jgi:hypothetical protein
MGCFSELCEQSLFMDFNDNAKNVEDKMADSEMDNIHLVMVEHRCGVIWRLGGYSCDGRTEAHQPVLDEFDLV